MASGGRNPGLALTTFRTETLVDWNRGRVRGWALLGAIVLAITALLSWPDGMLVLACTAGAVALALVEGWLPHTVNGSQMEPGLDLTATEPRDAAACGPD
jgi:hypothetical protein